MKGQWEPVPDGTQSNSPACSTDTPGRCCCGRSRVARAACRGGIIKIDQAVRRLSSLPSHTEKRPRTSDPCDPALGLALACQPRQSPQQGLGRAASGPQRLDLRVPRRWPYGPSVVTYPKRLMRLPLDFRSVTSMPTALSSSNDRVIASEKDRALPGHHWSMSARCSWAL